MIHQRAASPSAPAVVLLHGWPDSVLHFERVLPLLAGLHVVVPALPGFPFAVPLSGPASVNRIADVVAGAVGELGYDRYTVSGGDVGGEVAEVLAAGHPDRVTALHLTNVSPRHAAAADPADLPPEAAGYLGRAGTSFSTYVEPAAIPDRIDTPVVLSAFPHDIKPAPRSYAEAFVDVREFVEHDAGGHFAAWEQPKAYADDLRRAVRLSNPGACRRPPVMPHNRTLEADFGRRPHGEGITMAGNHVLDLREIDMTMAALAGGKGASLGELMRIGVRVPAGFCVTTDAFRRIVTTAPLIDERLDQLDRLNPGDRTAITSLSGELRQAIEDTAVPAGLAGEIARSVAALGERTACAVRSSATAEDLPAASFAGQQDTYLNVTGPDEIIRHVSRCWASLFSERAVLYRQRNGFGHREVQMAVVVQEMVVPQASGVLFTADPVTSNRKIVCVEAVRGLGQALVSGLVNADRYTIRDGAVSAREHQDQPVLADAQVLRLAALGRGIERHFGRPQDIEWCLADGEFQVVQARPITTLFPVPEAGDDGNHVYVSVGHQQMMTDAMKPLGISMWQLTAARPMSTAGGRLFVDVTNQLGRPASRAVLVKALGTSDPLIGDALRSVIDRGDFIPELPEGDAAAALPRGVAPDDALASIEADPAVVTEITDRAQASLDGLKRDIRGQHGQDLLDFIAADVQELKKVMFTPQSLRVIRAGMEASGWLNEHLREWLGDKNAADTLTQSAPGNVTAEMGLALLDVADTIRAYPEVVSFLEQVTDPEFLDQLPALTGGRAAREAIGAFLNRFGMRGVGEIDITRPRWSERPDLLLPVLLGNVRNFGAGAGKQRFEQGRREAAKKEAEILARLRTLSDGEMKAAETKRMIDRVRTFAGYREYPKYHMVSRYFVYKQALLAEADLLAAAGVLGEPEDIFYLTLGELGALLRTGKADEDLVRDRRDAFRVQAALTPPRVLTSDGEALTGSYRRGGIPAGALTGLSVSAGTVEGRARVIPDLSQAALEADDILVTTYTDPSWTPVFVAIKGLVTEVGGLMTHGAVIAREYGLPAVVGVEHATRLIRDGQRIRVHGTDGYVELLS